MNWLITGVSSGLGRALAEAALARGDRVAGTVRRPADHASFTALAPDRALAIFADLSDPAAATGAVEAATAWGGAIDVLVNNAGYGLIGAVEEVSLIEARAQFEVNVFAPLMAIKAVLPAMRARRAGRIINITSVSGLATWEGTGLYCASKFALEALGETLAAEVAPLGVKVTNIEPGGMRTRYAAAGLTIAEAALDDYALTAHNSRRILADHAGHEPTDPAKAAAAILMVVDAADPPLHLLLGIDAMLYASRRLGALQAEIGRWAPVTLGVGFEDEA